MRSFFPRGYWILLWLVLLNGPAIVLHAEGPGEIELYGVTVNGRDEGRGLLVWRQGPEDLRIPLHSFADLIGVELKERTESYVFQTPLGDIALAEAALTRRGQTLYVPVHLLEEKLAFQLRADRQAYALYLDLLWDPRPAEGTSRENPIQPEIRPAAFGLSRLRGEVRLRSRPGDSYGTTGFMEAFGRAGPGTWQIRLHRDESGRYWARDYFWKLRRERTALLVGNQFVNPHRLLSGFPLTGGQLAWSTHPEQAFSMRGQDRLINDRFSPIRTIRGNGPGGGTVELRINGKVVDRKRIPLDGRFEFPEFEVPTDYNNIEAVLYNPFSPGSPVEILNFDGYSSGGLMPPSGVLAYGGIGLEGNPFRRVDTTESEAGFFLGRVGATDFLTLELAASSYSEGNPVLLGSTLQLGPIGVLEGAYATDAGKEAYLLDFRGSFEALTWRARSLRRPPGFEGARFRRTEDHYGELAYALNHRMEVSMIGRTYREPGREVSFILPATRLRLREGMTLRSRPDIDGDYVHSLSWRINPQNRLFLRRDSLTTQATYNHDWSRRWRTSVSVSHDEILDRTLVDIWQDWRSMDPYGWFVRAGLSANEENLGWRLQSGRELLPGLRFFVEGGRSPDRAFSRGRETYLEVALSWDLGYTGSGFTRGGTFRAASGSVGGSLRGIPPGYDVGEVGIRLNGYRRGVTDRDGRFHVSSVRPGIYKVEIDRENLPVAISLEKDRFWVEVAEGAVTPVVFEVQLAFGISGRIGPERMTAEAPLRVRARDAQGDVAGVVPVHANGIWRLGGVEPGTYNLQLLDRRGEVLSERFVTVQNAHLFNILFH
ncbi:MAG: hypothetical protein GVY10_03045 [Verrucomicrobia bacterium]|jgi:hypothetical protein|nr:hypothetical protein [Verrucomicrobiota bacterium]